MIKDRLSRIGCTDSQSGLRGARAVRPLRAPGLEGPRATALRRGYIGEMNRKVVRKFLGPFRAPPQLFTQGPEKAETGSADSLSARLMPESERSLCRAVEVLDAVLLPADISSEFGKCEVKFICNKFNFSYADGN